MIAFLTKNAVTIIVVLILAALVFLAVRKMVKDKKAGIGPCGQRCENCPKMKNGSCNDGSAEK